MAESGPAATASSSNGGRKNAECRHSALGYRLSNHFETLLQTMAQLCPAKLDLLTPGPPHRPQIS